ncbi:MAG: sulfotransferase [Phycisphaerae bacterium]|jgi:hypothetical protein|nr:sulfotransferase [Phycisphaerae bacterium]
MDTLVYILSASHSGSTLLAMLLNAHPDMCSVGELKATHLGEAERYRCSCGQLIRQCSFWSRVSDAMTRKGISFDITHAGTDFRLNGRGFTRRLAGALHRGAVFERCRDSALRLSPAWRAHLTQVQSRNAALVDAIRDLTGARIVVDSSKIALRLKYLLRSPQFDVKVIRLVRDGRAVALTYMDPARFADADDPQRRGGGMGGERDTERLSMAQAALAWHRSNEEAEHVLARLDRWRWIEVRYEQVCTDPQGTLHRIFSFLGVDPSRWVPGFRSVEHHIVGNGMRLNSTSEIRPDERWKSALSKDDLAVFDRVAGATNRRYGYQ